MAVRAKDVARRTDSATVVEVQVARAVAASARRGRPIAAVVTDIVQAAIAAAITRSRIPSCGRR